MWSFVASLAEQSRELVAKVAATTESVADQINADVDAFEREKDKFTAAEEEHEQEDALPWEFSSRALVDYEDEIKGIMLKLSVDDNTFTQDPPEGVEFQFDLEAKLNVAARLLEFDPNLSKARFRLVPRIVKEPRFWRNYFYRISVIRDSYRLMGESSKTPLATRTESSAPLAAVLPVAAQPPPSSGAPPADEEAPVPSAQSEQPLGPPAVLSSAGSEDAFVMVEDDPDAFESALEAALNDTDGGLNAAMPGDGEGDLDEELQRRIEAELELMD